MTWQVIKDPGQSVIHILPLHDLGVHTESVNCFCEPEIKIIEDGSRDLLVHNLLWNLEDDALARAK